MSDLEGVEHSRRAYEAVLRNDFFSFVQKTFAQLNPGVVFFDNWHLEAIAWRLERVRRGEIKRLIINLPPRSLKSIMASVAFPAFVLGHDPRKQIIAVSYGDELSIKHSNDFRAVMGSEWYQGIFPGTLASKLKNTETEFATTMRGFRSGASIGGTLTGRGGDIIIIDDPLKPIDALSEPKREAVNHFFFHTLLSRLNQKNEGAIIIVMQRLHVDDLVGRLLRDNPEEWTILQLPALASAGERIEFAPGKYYERMLEEPLDPSRESPEALTSLRMQLGSDIFEAQYQQSPVPPGGAMIKRSWIQRYKHLPTRLSTSRIVMSWDTASKDGTTNDWSAGTVWLKTIDHHYFLIDMFRGRLDYPSLKAKALSFADLHRPNEILIEDTGVGTALIAELRRIGKTVIGVKPTKDKLTRMSIESAKFESGLVHLPEHAPWLAELESELFSFPNGRHDDIVDSISQALKARSGYTLAGVS